MIKLNPLKLFVQTVLETYIANEDFADVTKKTTSTSSRTKPQSSGQFDLNQFKKITNLANLLAYAASTLGNAQIGEGQGRIVYKLGSDRVLKIAKNPGGVGQNQAEAHVCAGSTEVVDLFPKIFEVGPNSFWLITQEASGMTPEVFLKLTGLTWENFVSSLKAAFEEKAKQVSEFDKQNFIRASTNPFFSRLVRVIRDCRYEPGDIAKLDSWGVIAGKPVILDSGFTEAVSQAYYKS